MKRVHMTLVLIAFSALTACNDDEENHTVEYYLDNPAERAEMLERCEVQDGAMQDANCVNAASALEISTINANRESTKEAVNSLYGGGN